MSTTHSITIFPKLGDLATAVRGKVDRIILTGGIAHSKMVADSISSYVDWIAPVELMPGEFEMEALAEGGLRILRGEEAPKPIDWQRK
jgi:butyrate kinase